MIARRAPGPRRGAGIGLVLVGLALSGCQPDTDRQDCVKYNLSPLTSPPVVMRADLLAPTDTSLVLRWEGYGDPCTHEAPASYEIRLTEEWRAAASWSEMATRAVRNTLREPGFPEYLHVGGLRPDREYFIGIRAWYPNLARASYHYLSARTTNCGAAAGEAAPYLVRVLDPEALGLGATLVAMDSDTRGRLFLLDGASRRVRRYSLAGGLEAEWPLPGTAELHLLACGRDDNVYVRSWDGRVARFSPDGAALGTPLSASSDVFDAAIDDMAIDADGTLYTVNRGRGRIQKISASGVLLATWGPNNGAIPKSLNPERVSVTATGELIVADTWHEALLTYTNTGVQRSRATWPVSCAGPVHDVLDMAAASAGGVFLLEQDNARVLRIDDAGRLLWAWGFPGLDLPAWRAPRALAPGPGGTLYILDDPEEDSGRQRLIVIGLPAASSLSD